MVKDAMEPSIGIPKFSLIHTQFLHVLGIQLQDMHLKNGLECMSVSLGMHVHTAMYGKLYSLKLSRSYSRDPHTCSCIIVMGCFGFHMYFYCSV